MRFYVLTIFCFLFSSLYSECSAQDDHFVEGDKIYRLVPSGNGFVREMVGRVGEEIETIDLALIYSHPGLHSLFKHLTAGEAGMLVSNEVTADQKEKLQKAINAFRKSSKDGGNIHKIRSVLVHELNEILIDEQLGELLDRYGNPNLLMTKLLGSKLGSELELSDTQRTNLLKTCSDVNGEIEELQKMIREKTEKLRIKLEKSYSDNLTLSQKTRFEKDVKFQKVLKKMNLLDIRNDTNFQDSSRK